MGFSKAKSLEYITTPLIIARCRSYSVAIFVDGGDSTIDTKTYKAGSPPVDFSAGEGWYDNVEISPGVGTTLMVTWTE